MSKIEPTPKQILDTPMEDNDSGADTIRGYLVELLAMVWRAGEGFSSKRPFGNSGWESDLYLPLAKAGFVEATFDEDGWIDEMSRDEETKADDLIAKAIRSVLVDTSPPCDCADAEGHAHTQAEHTNCGSSTAPCGACNNCASARKLVSLMASIAEVS